MPKTMLEMLKQAEKQGKICFNGRDNHDCLDYTALNFNQPFPFALDCTLSLLSEKGSEDQINKYLSLYLFSPRLLRGFIDNRLDFGFVYNDKDSSSHIRQKEMITNAITDIFAGEFNSAKTKLEYFKNNCIDHNLSDEFIQEYDYPEHWTANAPEKSDKLIDLIENMQEKPDHIIMIGHSSYRQGFVLQEATGIPAYAIRFSDIPCENNRPYFFNNEIPYLKQKFKDKNILLFDEFMFGGATMEGMRKLITKKIPKIKSLKSLCAHSEDPRYACKILN